MRLVVALGGNALLQRGDKPDAGVELEHIRDAAQALAPLAAQHELLICHGNGPQVGLLALESQTDPALTRPYPLDVLGAQTQGMIGYWLAQCLRNAGVTRPVISLITQVTVDPAEATFTTPTKFVGPGYPQAAARQLATRHGWTVARDGDQWRRVVPSPTPQRVIEHDTIAHLLAARAIVICGGGGGAPVTEDPAGHLTGVQAVIDKDLTAALLATTLHADRLLILTDVTAVMRDFATPEASPIRYLDLDQLADLHFPTGSMGPKIAACRQFVTATGKPAAIGSLTDATAVLAGLAGTTIIATGPSPEADAATSSAAAAAVPGGTLSTVADAPVWRET